MGYKIPENINKVQVKRIPPLKKHKRIKTHKTKSQKLDLRFRIQIRCKINPMHLEYINTFSSLNPMKEIGEKEEQNNLSNNHKS